MKKFITILFSIILILCCSYILSNAAIVKDSVRNIGTIQNFSGEKESTEEIHHWYFGDDLIPRADMLCAQHGGVFFSKEDIVVVASLVYNGNSYWEKKYEISPENMTSFVETLNTPITDKKIKDVEATLTLATNGFPGFPIKERLNIAYEDVSTSVANEEIEIETLGSTMFKYSSGGDEVNTTLAYILSECNNNANVWPVNSYVNIAFWRWQVDGNVDESGGSLNVHEFLSALMYDDEKKIDESDMDSQIKEVLKKVLRYNTTREEAYRKKKNAEKNLKKYTSQLDEAKANKAKAEKELENTTDENEKNILKEKIKK